MYQNYIFDLYGTLIDIKTDEYSKNFFKKYAKWLRKQGYAFSWKQFHKLYIKIEKRYREEALAKGEYQKPEIQVEDVFREVFWWRGYDLSDEEIVYLCEDFRQISLIYMSLFKDTIETLKQLKAAGKKIYLLSNAQRSFTWQELEQTGLLTYFDGLLISSDERCMKPDPRFFEILCERYGLRKEDCVMIGNELKSDIAGANAAKIASFYINRYPCFPKQEEVKYTYASVDGSLLEVLRQTGVSK